MMAFSQPASAVLRIIGLEPEDAVRTARDVPRPGCTSQAGPIRYGAIRGGGGVYLRRLEDS